MQAIILCAGYATRLYPLTESQPKSLLTVANKPILSYLIDKLQQLSEVSQIIIVTNDLFASHFQEWQKSYSCNKPTLIINDGTSSKETRLGAIGDLNFVLPLIHEDTLILGGDNLFEDDLKQLLTNFRQRGSTILLNNVPLQRASNFGIVKLDTNHRIIDFQEKPKFPHSNLAATLIYALKFEDLHMLPKAIASGFADRAGDFISYLIRTKEVYGLPIEGKWFDIGSFEALKEAEEYFSQ